MNISINVGNYLVVSSGLIDVFEKQDVILTINDSNSLKMKFCFIDNKENPKTYFENEIENDTLTWKIVNMNRNFSVLGISSPENIGEYENGKKMFFSFSVNAVNVDNGIFTSKYTFFQEL